MSVNILAVIVTALVMFFGGWLWYGPLFGKRWMQLTGKTEADFAAAKQKGMTGTYIAGLAQFFVIALVIGLLLSWGGAESLGDGLLFGFLAWLGFVGAVSYGDILWEGKSKKLWFLNNAYHLIFFLIASAILTLW